METTSKLLLTLQAQNILLKEGLIKETNVHILFQERITLTYFYIFHFWNVASYNFTNMHFYFYVLGFGY